MTEHAAIQALATAICDLCIYLVRDWQPDERPQRLAELSEIARRAREIRQTVGND